MTRHARRYALNFCTSAIVENCCARNSAAAFLRFAQTRLVTTETTCYDKLMEQVIAFASIGLSLFGPLIVALATSGRGWRRRPLAANVTAQILIAATTVATIFLTVWGLRSSLASIGLSMPDWHSPLLAVVLAVPFILAIGPWLLRLPGLLGFQGFERGFAQVNTIPLGALIVGVVVVGTCEEILYRGIGYSLLAEIVGPVLAIILASTAFMIAHIPCGGSGPR
jgi:membrane protease YdiL (CAAX protease family)